MPDRIYPWVVHTFVHIGAISALTLVTACGSSLPQLPVTPSAAPGFEPVPAPPTPAGIAPGDDPAAPLALRPGDMVTLYTQSGEDGRIEGLTVDERGVLHIPLAGDVDVAGTALEEAEGRIEAALRPFDSAIRVTILIAQPAGQAATVIGAVSDPGRFTVVPGMRVADLLALAGGGTTTEHAGVAISTANLDGARLVRAGRSLPISIALAAQGDPRHNVRIRAGDHIYVPPGLDGLVTVVGEVNAAQVMPFTGGLRLTTALGLAGGPTRDADHGEIIVVRGSADSPSVYRARLDQLFDGEGYDPILAAGDVVYVSPRPLARFRDVMSAIAPLVSIASSTAIGAAIVTSGP